jgi:RHS repeat-associated protein
MAYDAENKQISFTQGASGQTTAYGYDGDGHRVKKVTGGVTTVFVYNVGGQLIAEYDDLTTPPPGSGGTSYLTTDHLGSTRVVTGQDQSVKARHDYLPFGEEIAASTGRSGVGGYSANDPLRQRFTQKERDAETGLDYFLARYYSAAQGRFNSPDEFTDGPVQPG